MIPNQLSLDALRDFARNIEERLVALEARNVDFGQRRITNAGPSVGDFDYVTKFELRNLEKTVKNASSSITGALNVETLLPSGTYAQRPSAIPNAHKIYLASDRNYIGFYSTGTKWVYACGLHRDTFANRPTPTADEVNYPFYATDTFVLYFWTGAAWVEDILSTLEKFGGLTSSFPALKRSGTTLQARLADDSLYTAVEVLDEAYNKTNWDSKVEVPTKNAVRDELETRMPGVTAHTIPLAKLTSGGANGSITVNAFGIVTAYVDPT